MGISFSPMVFIKKPEADLELTLTNPTVLSQNAFRLNDGTLGEYITTLKSNTIRAIERYGVYGCSMLTTVDLPKCILVDLQGFRNCTALQNVTLGSHGNPVSSIAKDAFLGCEDVLFNLTVYTQGGVALADEPWDATSANIVYQAS